MISMPTSMATATATCPTTSSPATANPKGSDSFLPLDRKTFAMKHAIGMLSLAILAALPAPAPADLVMHVTSPTVDRGGTGTFDVLLTNTDPDPTHFQVI